MVEKHFSTVYGGMKKGPFWNDSFLLNISSNSIGLFMCEFLICEPIFHQIITWSECRPLSQRENQGRSTNNWWWKQLTICLPSVCRLNWNIILDVAHSLLTSLGMNLVGLSLAKNRISLGAIFEKPKSFVNFLIGTSFVRVAGESKTFKPKEQKDHFSHIMSRRCILEKLIEKKVSRHRVRAAYIKLFN